MMLAAVQFNNQLTRRAIKIHDIVPNVFLPVKLLTSEAFLSPILPELKFCISGVLAKPSDACLKSSLEWEHGKSPLPPFRKGG
jgi:hypothetical protein